MLMHAMTSPRDAIGLGHVYSATEPGSHWEKLVVPNSVWDLLLLYFIPH
jgi:hypothetical protein